MKKKVVQSATSIPGPENITRRVLGNGIVVLARENFTSPAVVVDCDVRVGALWHGREQAGLSDFTAAAMMRGTERFAFAEIYEQIESVGASLSVSGGTHTSGFYAKCLAEDLDLIMGLAADALRHPIFPAEQVERLRGEILTRLKIHANDTRARANEAFYELAYPGHPYAVDEEGYEDTISALTRDELAAFHRAHWGPRGMTVTVVGAIAASGAIALVEKHFADWRNDSQIDQPVLPPVLPLTGLSKRHVPMPGKSQSDVVFGVPGPARKHPHFLAARLANNILGVFGMGGRIGHEVREKNGMAYYAAASLGGGLGPGAWHAYAGVNPGNVERAVELMRREIQKMTSRKVTPTELTDNQAQFIGRMPLSMETNEGVASLISSMEMFDLGLDYVQRFPDLIRAITRDEVLAVTREFLSAENAALVVAGPE
ncbi:MAG: M16 family metallopeptidase [Anaerolineales bacterium]